MRVLFVYIEVENFKIYPFVFDSETEPELYDLAIKADDLVIDYNDDLYDSKVIDWVKSLSDKLYNYSIQLKEGEERDLKDFEEESYMIIGPQEFTVQKITSASFVP